MEFDHRVVEGARLVVEASAGALIIQAWKPAARWGLVIGGVASGALCAWVFSVAAYKAPMLMGWGEVPNDLRSAVHGAIGAFGPAVAYGVLKGIQRFDFRELMPWRRKG